MNKKAYITPALDIVRIAQASMIAASLKVYDSTTSEDNTITSSNSSSFEFNSNAFEGGLMDE
jgi:hypothetical protein